MKENRKYFERLPYGKRTRRKAVSGSLLLSYKKKNAPYPSDTGSDFFFRIRIKRIKDSRFVHFLRS